MFTRILFLFFSFFSLHGGAQMVHSFVPKKPVQLGMAFQVQYIISHGTIEDYESPQFDSMKLVSGPNIYKGTITEEGKTLPIENITYTLVPQYPGKFEIPALTINFKNGTSKKSESTFVTVQPQPKASFSASSNYTDVKLFVPRSKADVDRLIQENLFIRTEVNRRSIFIGEPLVVSFKLFSSLQSTSEVINAPSLYGFSVVDMLDIYEAHPGIDTIGNKIFNTSILRQLQLYPGQTGKLVIDEMRLQNEIEFEDAISGGGPHTEYRVLASTPVKINVLPLPAPAPAGFNGAVGMFSLTASLDHTQMKKGESNTLWITVSGKGNFIQLAPPEIHWPEGIDVFDSSFADKLNLQVAPTEGSRKYEFRFTAEKEGVVSFPSASFVYFEPASRSYKTTHTEKQELQVTKGILPIAIANGLRPGGTVNWWLLLIPLALVAGMFLFFLKYRKQKNIPVEEPGEKLSLLQKANSLQLDELSGQQACLALQKILYEALTLQNRVHPELEKEFREIGQECQLMAYSSANIPGKKEELKQRIITLLRKLKV